jgi:hypothetical protein
MPAVTAASDQHWIIYMFLRWHNVELIMVLNVWISVW